MVNPPLKFVLVDANIYQNIYQNILEGWVEGVAIEHSVILWQARVQHDITTALPSTSAPQGHNICTGIVFPPVHCPQTIISTPRLQLVKEFLILYNINFYI